MFDQTDNSNPEMDSSPTPQSPTLLPVDMAKTARRRKISWALLWCVMVIPLWLVGTVIWWYAWYRLVPFSLYLRWAWLSAIDPAIRIVIPLLGAMTVAVIVARRGNNRGWNTSKALSWGWALAVLLTVVTVGGSLLGYGLMGRSAADKSVASHQIAAAAENFFEQHPERIFASFDDLIGPGRNIRSAPDSSLGVDYHEVFPLRRDFEALTVTATDRHRVIVYWPPKRFMDYSSIMLRESTSGHLSEINGSFGGAGLTLYRKWLEAQSRPDGMQVKPLPDGRIFEMTYRNGVPEGQFRAYYDNGKLWGEASYTQGVPTGKHRIFDQNGQVIYETTFVPWKK